MDRNTFPNRSHEPAANEPKLAICPDPIFIIGSPRSGTTILAWSLAQHSQLWTSDESQILWDLFGDGRLTKNYQRHLRPDGSWLQKQGIDKAEFLGFLGLGLNALFASKSEGKRWIDQTPMYTLMVDDLVDVFPGAFFIHILRDGRAVVHSMIHYLDRFGDKDAPIRNKAGFPPWATDFRQACRTWNSYVEISLDLSEKYPARCLTVVNEQLVANPSKSFREILQFIKAPEEPAPANYFQSNRINSSFPKDVQKPPGPPPISTIWEGWTGDQRKIFEEEAGPTLEKYLQIKNESSKAGLSLQIADVVRAVVPPSAKVMVVSKGDEELLNLPGKEGWHFPRTDSGEYAGYYPSDSSEAIDHLEAQRAKGAEFLLFPHMAFWWLDHYIHFREHLDSQYRRVWADECCIIYQLSHLDSGDFLPAHAQSERSAAIEKDS